MDILEVSLSPARNWTMIYQLSSPLAGPCTYFYIHELLSYYIEHAILASLEVKSTC